MSSKHNARLGKINNKEEELLEFSNVIDNEPTDIELNQLPILVGVMASPSSRGPSVHPGVGG